MSAPAMAQPHPAIATQSKATAMPHVPVASAPTASSGASDAGAASAPQPPSPGVAALDASPLSAASPNDLPDGTTLAPVTPKKPVHHTAGNTNQPGPGLGSALRRMFSAHAGTSYYPN
jgi:hypothetical protein